MSLTLYNMYNLLSGLFIFFLVFLLICVFHFFCWNLYFGKFLSGLRSWVSSFECGFQSGGLVETSFSFTYFILLVFFVIFDLEISLLLKMPLQGILYKKLFFYSFFLFLVCFGFISEVIKGYVSWGY